jgi:hypothetical protein
MNKWMKIGGILLVAALMVTALGAFALAQGPQGNGDGVRAPVGAGSGPAWGFVDEDNDGVNDRYEDGQLFVDEDGDGICDVCGSAEPLGPGYSAADGTGTVGGYGLNQANSAFIDEDGDGICDVCGSAEPLGPGYSAADGTGTVGGYGLNQASEAFVDEDGDGVCDNYAQYSGQRMMGRGRWASGQ